MYFVLQQHKILNQLKLLYFFKKSTSKIIVRQHRAWTTGKVSETKTWQNSLVSDSVWRELQKAADTKTWLFMKSTWEEGAGMGEDVDQGGLSLPGKLLCLYYIPSVSCYSLVPALAQRGLTKKKKKKSREGEAQEGIPGHKRFTSPLSRNQFFKPEQWIESKKKWSKIGRARWGGGGRSWGLMTVRRNI